MAESHSIEESRLEPPTLAAPKSSNSETQRDPMTEKGSSSDLSPKGDNEKHLASLSSNAKDERHENKRDRSPSPSDHKAPLISAVSQQPLILQKMARPHDDLEELLREDRSAGGKGKKGKAQKKQAQTLPLGRVVGELGQTLAPNAKQSGVSKESAGYDKCDEVDAKEAPRSEQNGKEKTKPSTESKESSDWTSILDQGDTDSLGKDRDEAGDPYSMRSVSPILNDVGRTDSPATSSTSVGPFAKGKSKQRGGEKMQIGSNPLSALPSAPKAAYQTVDMSLVPTQPPFFAYYRNAPFEAKEVDLEEFFNKLSIRSTVKDKETRASTGTSKVTLLSGREGKVEFETRAELISALERNNEMFRARPIELSLPDRDRDTGEPRDPSGSGRPGSGRWTHDRYEGRSEGGSGKWQPRSRGGEQDKDKKRTGYVGTLPSESERDFKSWRRNDEDEPEQRDDRARRPDGPWRRGGSREGDAGGAWRERDRDRERETDRVRDQNGQGRDRGEKRWTGAGSSSGAGTGDWRRDALDSEVDRERDRSDREQRDNKYSQYGQYNQRRSTEAPSGRATDSDRDRDRDRERDRDQEIPRAEPAVRKKLDLKPRQEGATVESSERSSKIFGSARPVDTRAKEAHIEEQLAKRAEPGEDKDKEGDSERIRDKDRDLDREHDRDKERERDGDRDRDRDRDRERERDRLSGRPRGPDSGRVEGETRDSYSNRTRYGGYREERDRDRNRDRDLDREWDRNQDRDRDRESERYYGPAKGRPAPRDRDYGHGGNYRSDSRQESSRYRDSGRSYDRYDRDPREDREPARFRPPPMDSERELDRDREGYGGRGYQKGQYEESDRNRDRDRDQYRASQGGRRNRERDEDNERNANRQPTAETRNRFGALSQDEDFEADEERSRSRENPESRNSSPTRSHSSHSQSSQRERERELHMGQGKHARQKEKLEEKPEHERGPEDYEIKGTRSGGERTYSRGSHSHSQSSGSYSPTRRTSTGSGAAPLARGPLLSPLPRRLDED